MSRIDTILTKVRDVLVDVDKRRWSDDRLIRLVDEAQSDIAAHSKILKDKVGISLVVGQSVYELPDNLWLLTRAATEGRIPLISHDKMDAQSDDWETDVGSTVTALVYDERSLENIRVYPIPSDNPEDTLYTMQNAGYLDESTYIAGTPYGVLTDAEGLQDLFGVVVYADDEQYLITDPDSCNGYTTTEVANFDSVYGAVASMVDSYLSVGFHGDSGLGEVVGIDDYTLDSVYGFTIGLYDPEIGVENFDSPYGLVSNIAESNNVLSVNYIKTPKEITNSNDELEIPTVFDAAIRYYVIGHAFLDDVDTSSQRRAADNINLYERELNLVRQTSSTDGSRTSQTNRTIYRGAFN